ncbi:MAG: cohesin domain-containing protein, partial [Ruminococcus sp.]|nr:cohesin domain-containing protein [Ruminococcus sp.]
MKKLLSVIVLAAMLVTMVCPSFAAPADSHDHSAEVKEFDAITFTVDDVTAKSDAKTVDVAVRVAGNGEHNCKTGIWGAAVSLYYPGDLKVVDIKNGNLFPDSEVAFELDSWNASAPDSYTQTALDANKVDVAGKDYRYGRFIAEMKDPEGGTLENGVLFTVTVELPDGAAAGDSWEIGVVANADDVIDCGTLNAETNKLEFVDIPFSLDNGSVSVAYSTEISVGDAVAVLGEEVTIPVTISDNPGMFITRLTASYDAEKLEFVGAANGDVTADSYVIATEVENGNLTLYFESSNNKNISGDGVLVNLAFKAVREAEAGETLITLVAEDAVNVDGADIDVILNAGTVTLVNNTTVTVENATVTATYDVEVPVSVASNVGLWALRAEYTYDAELLTFNGIKSGIYAAEDGVNYSEKNGVITVFFEGAEIADVKDDGVLFTLVFTAGKKAGTSDITMNLIDAINTNGEDVDVKTADGIVDILPAPAIAVGSAETYADKTVDIPVTISGNTGVVSVRMEIAYDAANLRFAGVKSGLLPADETNASAKDGVITVFVENDTVADMTENGVLFDLVFTTLNNEDAECVLSATVLADSTIN